MSNAEIEGRTRLRGQSFWQYSLRNLLLAVFFAAVACGCFRLASVYEIRAAVIPGVLAVGVALGLLTHHTVAACVGVILVALASYIFTRCYWDYWFPDGEIRLHVCDPSGSPVAGAQFEVYSTTKIQQVERGLLLEDDKLPLFTDVNGDIVCHSVGRLHGGVGWHLFWCIPIGYYNYDYGVCISHKEFGPVSINFVEMLAPSNKRPSQTNVVVNGQSVQMPVYTVTVPMPLE